MPMFAEEEYRLRLGDFDRFNRLQPASVLDIFQDIANIQSQSVGASRDEMLERGFAWVVTRCAWRMFADPPLNSTVLASTWPHTMSRLSVLRDYRLRTPEGVVLAEGTSEWLIIDVKNRKVAETAIAYDGPHDFLEERTFEHKPRKITQLPDEGAESITVVPSFADVDANGHVNNARYASFAISALNPGKDGAIGGFQIDFRHEVLEGEPLVVRCQTIDGHPTMAGYNTSGEVAFACRVDVR